MRLRHDDWTRAKSVKVSHPSAMQLPALIAKSTAYILATASIMVHVRFYKTSASVHPFQPTFPLTKSVSSINIPTISPVHPSTNKPKPTIMVPPIMKGLRRPHLDLELSASTPTTGCIISPESGPAIHTSDVWALLRPSWRRYGVQSVSGILARPRSES